MKTCCHLRSPFLCAGPNLTPQSDLSEATDGPAGDRWGGSEQKEKEKQFKLKKEKYIAVGGGGGGQ